MEFARARQILNAKETFDIFFNGSPVWIESLNSCNHTARIKPLNGEQAIKEVPVAELIES